MKGADGMRILLTFILTAAAVWSGYWYLGASGMQSAFQSWFEARRAEGWVAETSDLRVRGYPNRFDTGMTDLALADPDTGLAWEAPFFQLLALSYRPNHVIAIWPETQLIATPLQKYRLRSHDMRASLVVAPKTHLAIQRSTLTAERLLIAPVGEAEATRLDSLSLAMERQPAAADERPQNRYRIGFEAQGLAPSQPLRLQLDPEGRLPQDLGDVRADMTVRFDKPWNRSAIEVARPQPQHIRIDRAEARWGRLLLQMAGEVSVDAAGQPTGEITVKAENWRDILDLAVASGALGPGMAETLARGLSMVAQMSGNTRTLDLPLSFRNGRVMLGPVPLGAAPVLRLR